MFELIYSLNEIKCPVPCEQVLVVLDVDDTLITPRDKAFRYDNGQNPFYYTFDTFKREYRAGQHDAAHFEQVVSSWRLQRTSQLVEAEWVSWIATIQEQGGAVIALTSLDVGKFGCIDSIEEWRYRELKEHGIEFSELLKEEGIVPLDPEGRVTHHQGIVIADQVSKREALKCLMKRVDRPIQQVIFVDDREYNVRHVIEACDDLGIACAGYHYRHIEQLAERPDPVVAQFQMERLFKTYIWHSDEEAEALMSHSD